MSGAVLLAAIALLAFMVAMPFIAFAYWYGLWHQHDAAMRYAIERIEESVKQLRDERKGSAP